ncbi:MAG: DUF2384 domain-containing protein [Nitrospirae bacterium]|nr:DUF2384 domain-containing protein [Nitrospirota bacterium]
MMEIKETVRKRRRLSPGEKYRNITAPGRVKPRVVIKHFEALGLDLKTLALCLLVNPKTIQRWQDAIAEPNEAALRSLDKLEAMYQLAASLLKKDLWKTWFHSPNKTLGEERPVDLLRRGEVDQVRNVLGMLKWGIYS